MIMIKQCSHITGFDPGDFWEFISELLMCTKTFCWTVEDQSTWSKIISPVWLVCKQS